VYEEGFYPGVVGEMPKNENGGRYLVFYDDGYVSYHHPEDLRQVCKSTGEFLQKVEPAHKQFIERYLTEYPWRKMVKLALGDKITKELHGIWILGEVTEVDASLVEITFKDQGGSELIYRGSARLQPLFKLLQMKTVFKSPSEGHLVLKTLPAADYLHQVHDCSPSCVSSSPTCPTCTRPVVLSPSLYTLGGGGRWLLTRTARWWVTGQSSTSPRARGGSGT
jgi:hypothetical protein